MRGSSGWPESGQLGSPDQSVAPLQRGPGSLGSPGSMGKGLVAPMMVGEIGRGTTIS